MISGVTGGKKMKGGTSLPALKPNNFNGGLDNNLPSNQNFAKMPNVFPQKGGVGYGYSDTSDVAAFGGSYNPITSMCTAGGDVSRGGNNFGMTGGGKRRTIRRTSRKSRKSPTSASRRYNKSKKSIFSFRNLFSRKLSKNRSSSRKSGGNKYPQKGCSKKNKKGGFASMITGGNKKNKKGGSTVLAMGGGKAQKGGNPLLVGGSCIAVL